MNKSNQWKYTLLALLAVFCLALVGCGETPDAGTDNFLPASVEDMDDLSDLSDLSALAEDEDNVPDLTEVVDELSDVLEEAYSPSSTAENAYNLSGIPPFSGSPYTVVNGNVPGFTDEDLTTASFETYSELDTLGRCGVAYANIGTDLMPTQARGSIGQVKPSGWHSSKYDIVDGKYLYNRCHLIGYQLTAENANRQNLITGTRYLNVIGMLPFENLTADYIKETGNHVLYRVTPVFAGDNLVADGVQMEAMSVEDNGDGVLFNVYCYNVQPGIVIDYATGESYLAESEPEEEESAAYVLNTNTKKFHLPSCSSAERISDTYRLEYTGSREALLVDGYTPCQRCNP